MRRPPIGTCERSVARDEFRVPNRSVKRGPLSHGVTLATFDRLSRRQAQAWARRLVKMVADEPIKTPEAHLIARGMEDAEMRAQVLREYEEMAA